MYLLKILLFYAYILPQNRENFKSCSVIELGVEWVLR